MKMNLSAPPIVAIENEQPNEKYSLRQRQKRSTRNTSKQTENSTKIEQAEASIGAANTPSAETTPTSVGIAPSANGSSSSSSSSERSSQQTKTNKKSATKTKSKQKAAPLSKYRRKTANARERIRMREINSAFEHLRQCVPTSFCETNPHNSNEKLTKITTLRMAMKYINTLTNILNSSDTSNDETNALVASIMSKNCNQMPMSNTFINNNNDTITINNNNNNKTMEMFDMEAKATMANAMAMMALSNTTTASNKAKSKGKSKKATNATTNKTINKRKSTKSKATTTKPTNKTNAIEKTIAIKSQLYDAIPNTINTLCLTPPLSSTDSPIDLGLMLESDGESLHLSEPLSPPLSSTSTPSSSASNQKQFISTTVTAPASMTMSNGLDIGLFLDSDTDSLQFPEPCLSPLDGGFDAFSPFGDLLNPGFPEHSSLDIYLT